VDRRTRLRVRLGAERVECPLEIADLLLGLAMVRAEVLLELRVVRLLRELLEHPEDRLLHGERGAQLLDEQLARSLDLGHLTPLLDLAPATRARPAQTRESRSEREGR